MGAGFAMGRPTWHFEKQLFGVKEGGNGKNVVSAYKNKDEASSYSNLSTQPSDVCDP